MPGVDWDRGWSAREGEQLVVDTLADKFWTQHVRGATHIGGNTLDLFTSSNPDMVVGVEKHGYLGNGDHLMLEASIVGPSREEESTQLVPDWLKADIEGMKNSIAEVDWQVEFGEKSGKECMEVFYNVLDREIEKHVPMKLRRAGQKPIWMSKNIMRLIRKKKRLWRWYSQDGGKDYASFEAFRNVQKEVKKAVRQAKKKLERKLAKEAKKNAKQFHSYIKKKTSNRVTVGPLKAGEELVTDNQQMCNMLNDFFCSVFTEENLEEIPVVSQQYKGDEPLEDVPITKEKVRKKLADLKPSSAPGPDKVWARILQKLADELAEPLSFIFTKLLEEGDVPDIWKTASVCPVFKKGGKGDPGNYRPISLTCILCKVMEGVVRDAMVKFLLKNMLICSSQHGFLPGRSTLTNLLEYLETLTRLIDEGHQVDVLYLDFRKAFDVVPKERLLAKMESIGVRGKVQAWVREWLTGRTQRVVLNGKESGLGHVRSGVVQGSTLGPTLFLIYINDISSAVRDGESALDMTSSILSMFADDTKWGRCVDTEENRHQFQDDIERLGEWSKTWQLHFNTDKCKVMHLGKKNTRKTYMMDGDVLEATAAEKDIGVMVQENFKPSLHCVKVAAKTYGVLGQLGRVVLYRDSNTFIRLYLVYVRPILEYCIQAVGPHTAADKLSLERVQMRAVRMVSNIGGGTYMDKLAKLKLTTLEERRWRGDMIQTWRIMTGKDRVKVSTWFDLEADRIREGATTTRNAKGHHAIRPREYQHEERGWFFSNRVVKDYNALPDHVKEATTINMFKNSLDIFRGTPNRTDSRPTRAHSTSRVDVNWGTS